jgi:hypothetical protein
VKRPISNILVAITSVTILGTGLIASAKAPDTNPTRPAPIRYATDRTTTTTSTTTTTAPPSPPSTLPPLAFEPKCPNLIGPARFAGFPEHELEHLDYLAWRESRCDIDHGTGQPRCAHNGDDPGSGKFKGSWGAWQINQSWTVKNKWNPHPAGYLGNLGILDETIDLCSWEVNARAAFALYQYSIDRHGYDKRWWQWKV